MLDCLVVLCDAAQDQFELTKQLSQLTIEDGASQFEQKRLDTAKLVTRHLLAPSSYKQFWSSVNTDKLRTHRTHSDIPPLTLYHRVFAQFVEDYKLCVPDASDTAFVAEITTKMCVHYDKEAQRTADFDDLFTKYAGFAMGKIGFSKYYTDSSLTASINSKRVMILNREDKAEPGSSGDAFMQNAAYYAHWCCDDSSEEVRSRTTCPMFLMDLVGPYVSVSGGIFLDSLVVSPLTPILRLFYVQNDPSSLQLARFFRALKNGINSLHAFYEKALILPPLSVDKFPYPREYSLLSHKVCFSYQSSINHRVFVCQVSSVTEQRNTACPESVSGSGHQSSDVQESQQLPDINETIIVKFVRYYGSKAHQTLAKANCAPQLYAVVKLSPDWLMVVMSRVVGQAPSDGKVDKTTFEQLSAALKLLHNANLVHGDLRSNNVMVSDKGVFVVDFDWSGEHEIQRYPYFMNDTIRWPDKVGDNATMKFEHDLEMLNRMAPDQ